jgi:hypothetical protein
MTGRQRMRRPCVTTRRTAEPGDIIKQLLCRFFGLMHLDG